MRTYIARREDLSGFVRSVETEYVVHFCVVAIEQMQNEISRDYTRMLRSE